MISIIFVADSILVLVVKLMVEVVVRDKKDNKIIFNDIQYIFGVGATVFQCINEVKLPKYAYTLMYLNTPAIF